MTTNDNASRLNGLQGRIRTAVTSYIALLLVLFTALIVMHVADIVQFISHIWIFGPIGVFGAIIANSTGTGGGVVFDDVTDRTGLGGAGKGSGHRQTGHAVFAQAADYAGNDDFLCHPGTLVADGF